MDDRYFGTNEVARQNENFKDIDLDFLAHPATNDVVKKTGAAAIKRSIRNLVLLRRGELPFNQNKGCGIYHQLFELYTPATVAILEREIYETIKMYEPRVNVLEIDVKDYTDRNGINIDIFFEIINFNEPQSLSIFLERVR